MERKSYFVDMLMMMGINVMYACREAERACSMLSKDSVVDAVLSKDSDNIPLGCLKLITSFSYEAAECLHTVELMRLMNFTRDELLDFCILCGTDYNVTNGSGRSGMSPEQAFKYVHQYRTIENVVKHIHIPNGSQIHCRNIYCIRSTSEELGVQRVNVLPNTKTWIEHVDYLKFIGMSSHNIEVMTKYHVF